MPGMTPKGLSYDEKETLRSCVEEAEGFTLFELLIRSEVHVRASHRLAEGSSTSNAPVAEAILNRIKRIICEWEDMPMASRPWLKGMMLYFIHTHDGYGDFHSPVGFDDDVNVLNACLKLIDREDLCLDVEAFE